MENKIGLCSDGVPSRVLERDMDGTIVSRMYGEA